MFILSHKSVTNITVISWEKWVLIWINALDELVVPNGCIPGVTHFVIGAAGYHLNPLPSNPGSEFIVTRSDTYGFLRMNFSNSTQSTLKFISDDDGSVLDEVIVYNKFV